jgi:hypothetical protein
VSQADDSSLLAMKAAKMSVGSIAFTMDWTERRVERRLAELQAATLPQVPVTPERRPPANPVRIQPPKPRPKACRDGEGLVTRTFVLASGGLGAAVVLADQLVFTETGTVRPDLGAHIPIQPGDGCYQLVDRQ